MTDVKKTDKAEKADETPKVVHSDKVGNDTYFIGENGERWVERGE